MWSNWRRLMTDGMNMVWLRAMRRINRSVAEVFAREENAGLREQGDPECGDEDILLEDRDVATLPVETPSANRRPVRAQRVGSKRIRMARGITVDSGAADNVLPRRILRKGMKMRQSEASRLGVHYVAANGARIPNEGEVDFGFEDKDGKAHSWVFQIAEVNKVLASVSALVDSNHRVTFDKDDKTGVDLSFITNKITGQSIRMRRDRNVWTIDAFVNEDSDFRRPE